MSEPIEDHDSLEACVAHRIELKADRIKLICSGIIDFKRGRVTKEPQMSADEVARIVAEARRFDRQVFAHASGDDGIERAIEGGVDSVEHGFFIRDDQLSRMRDRDIGLVPTFAPVQKQIEHADRIGWDAHTVDNLRRILDGQAKALQRALAIGVRIVAGSDAGSCGVPHGLGLLYELEQLERAGMATAKVIHAATGAGADRFDYAEPIGRLATGYRSRFILTSHSPLDGISNLGKAKIVIFDGEAVETLPLPTIGVL